MTERNSENETILLTLLVLTGRDPVPPFPFSHASLTAKASTQAFFPGISCYKKSYVHFLDLQ